MMFMIKRGEQEFGPYSGADIQQYLRSGNIVESDLVRAEGTDRWLTVRDIVGGAQPQSPTPEPSAQPGYTPAPSPEPMFTPSPSPASYGAESPSAGFDASAALSVGSAASQAGGTGFSAPASVTPAWPSAQPAQRYGGAAGGSSTLKNGAPLPPNLNWVIVLVASIFTCGLFALVWLFIEAAWFKKLDPQSKGQKFLIFYLVGYAGVMLLSFGGMGVSMAMPDSSLGALISGMGSLLSLGLLVLYILAVFNMKASLEGYFNSVEPINLRLNPILVFFFAVVYFQYHFNRINTWKTTGNLV
ncbi:MAG: GYF domain-containing protein [Bryobacterales bacterium]|nr:GYF domain-containing protein [Bryobacterales bacterium]